MKFPLIVAIIYALVLTVIAAPPVATSAPTTKTPSIAEICTRLVANKTGGERCDACVSTGQCLYCYTDSKCKPYPIGHLFPSGSDCPPDMGSARWGTCVVNFKVLLIAMGIVAGILLIVVPCCIYCCCCRGRRMSERNRRRLAKEEEKWQREEESRKARHAEKREERQKRYDEIRQKYGLVKPGSGSGNNYQRFENEA